MSRPSPHPLTTPKFRLHWLQYKCYNCCAGMVDTHLSNFWSMGSQAAGVDGSLDSSACASEKVCFFPRQAQWKDGGTRREHILLSHPRHSPSSFQLWTRDKALCRLLGQCFCVSGCGSQCPGWAGWQSLCQARVPGAWLLGGGSLYFLEMGFISFLHPLLPTAHLSCETLDPW